MINCIYIHIPFCEKKCNYCAFCSFETAKYKEEYIKALIEEIKFHYKNNLLKTIYFGGGTPSLLENEEIKALLDCFNFDKNTEITLEANPGSLTKEKIKFYKNIGINRLSLGVQSFDNKILKEIGRTHNLKDIYNSIENILSEGINNYSIDLIYGLPYQSLKNWQETLFKAIKLKPHHISLYGLKIEKGTKFYLKTPSNIANDELQAQMYETAVEILKEKYLHYEFSNFALNENYISKNNKNYWQRGNYYGFGLSASGFVNNKRYTNTFNLKEYLNNHTEKNYEKLTRQNEIEEEIFLGLRLVEGINFSKINEKYNTDILKKYGNIFKKYIESKYMEKTHNGVKLTIKGILVSNEILSEFIEV